MQITKIPAKLKENKKLRVAAYARVSADKDAAFHSLEAQTEYYQKYVSRHPDWMLVGIYSDNGISGTIIDRPEFQRMLEDCRAGKIDLVVTKSVTRFARNTVVLLDTVRELKALGIDCFFEKENMHSISPDGELLLTLLAMYAEEEARSASENQRWKIKKRFEAGEAWVGNMLGYRLVDGNMVIIPEEAEIVRNIFSDYLSGMGKQSIAKKYRNPDFGAPIIAKCGPSTISRILRNEKYMGDMLLQKYYCPDFIAKKRKENHGEVQQYYVENSHEPIIDRETFEAVQAEIQRRKPLEAAKKPSEDNLFVGMIRCGICGCHFVRKRQASRAYHSVIWVCNTYLRKGKEQCPSQKIPESILIKETSAVLGVDSLTRANLLDILREIQVPAHNHLCFIFKDGDEKEVEWQYPSRSLSWTPEMRKQARERTMARYRKEDSNE